MAKKNKPEKLNAAEVEQTLADVDASMEQNPADAVASHGVESEPDEISFEHEFEGHPDKDPKNHAKFSKFKIKKEGK